MIPEPPSGDFALFLDVDGTLIDIAARPDSVVVPGSLVEDLEDLNRRLGGALALVSGRTISNLDALFHPLRLRASGVHGAEFRFEPDQADVVVGAPAIPDLLWRELSGLVEGFPGAMAENKTYSFAVHYRSVPKSRGALVMALEQFIAAHADLQLRIMPGHFVFEIKRSDFNKGVAVERFLQRREFQGRRPIFVGDDVTDWPGFTAALNRDGLAYAVGGTPVDVTGTFPDPPAVRTWLRQITLFRR